MTDQTDSGLGTSVKQLFSPAVLTALRYLLTAVSPLLAVVGVVALSPQQIDHIIATAQQIGVVVGAIAALIGIVAPIGAGIWGTFKSTSKQQIQSVAAIANDPTQPQSADAKQTLIAATISLPEVQTIVTDKATADAAPSESVVAAGSVTITPPTK